MIEATKVTSIKNSDNHNLNDKFCVLLTSCWSGRQAIDSSGVSWSELHWNGLLPPGGTFSCQYCLNKTYKLIGFENVSLYLSNMYLYLYYEFCNQFTLIYFNLLEFTLIVFLVDIDRFSKKYIDIFKLYFYLCFELYDAFDIWSTWALVCFQTRPSTNSHLWLLSTFDWNVLGISDDWFGFKSDNEDGNS